MVNMANRTYVAVRLRPLKFRLRHDGSPDCPSRPGRA
jgi:hypothetical protein